MLFKVLEVPRNFFQEVSWWGAGVKPLRARIPTNPNLKRTYPGALSFAFGKTRLNSALPSSKNPNLTYGEWSHCLLKAEKIPRKASLQAIASVIFTQKCKKAVPKTRILCNRTYKNTKKHLTRQDECAIMVSPLRMGFFVVPETCATRRTRLFGREVHGRPDLRDCKYFTWEVPISWLMK